MRKKSPAAGDDASVAGEPGVGAREKKIEEDAAVRRRNGGRQSAYPCALSF